MGTENWQRAILLSKTMGFQMGMFFIWFSSSLICKSSMLELHMEKSLLSMFERSKDVGYVKQQVAKNGKGLVDVEDQEIVWDDKWVDGKWVLLLLYLR